MIKKLSRVLGKILADGKRPGLGVIGRVDTAPSGNTIIEVGTVNNDGSWSKTVNGGHVVLVPNEVDEFVRVLESHQEYRTIRLGDTVAVDYTVTAVQYLNATSDDGRLRGTILAYSSHQRKWAVLTANPHGEVNYGTYTSDSQRALNAYAARIVEHLYPHFNASPPTLTFAHVAERDKLKSGT